MPNYIAKTMAGLEGVLADELTALGATGVRPLKRAVAFEGDTALMYRANYELRTALRILQPLHSFEARNEQAYYRAIRDIDWSKHLAVSGSLAVDAVVKSEIFRHSQFLALLTKDAIVDQFRDRFNRRPDVNTVAPDLRIHVHAHDSRCEVALDTSGDSLHKRHYRRDTVEAPLNEVLAAGMILLTGWDGRSPFVDPMCGSGTLPIEAALLARRMPPQYLRPGFGFYRWPDFDAKLWKNVKKAADDRIQAPEFPILAADKDNRARNATSINVMAAGLEEYIQIEKTPFEKLEPPAWPGILIMNPPYDERLKLESAVAFYKSIGDRLKQRWAGWDAWILSAHLEALKHLGLHASRRIQLLNGALECGFHKFSLYEGTKNTP